MNFRTVYEENFDFVWRSLRRLGVREADLPDAMQEVFVVVHRKLDEFEGRARITTWLFRICMNVARDRHRLAHVRREVLDEDRLASALDDREDVSVTIERKQAIAQLEAALERLDFDQRAVFVLFELEGQSGDEIAATLQIPLGTVWSRLRLGREAFRKAFTHPRATQGPSRRDPTLASGES